MGVFETVDSIKLKLNRIFFDLEHANLKVEVFERLEAVAVELQDACAKGTDSALASLHLDYDSSYGVVHHLQAALLCELIGKRLGVKDAERRVLVKAALTHDIGLHDIQNTLDRQVEPLTDLQRDRIKSHPEDSVRLLAQLGIADIVWLNVVLNHHERIDGSGYPSGCAGDAISVPARILAVADTYSAMVRDRPYRKALVSKDAMRQMLTDQGKTIDARITQLMIKEVGVFPPGTTVKLSTGEIAVVKERGVNTAFPVTYAFVRPDGMPRLTPVRRQTNNTNCVIEGLVPFSKYRAATSIIQGLWREPAA
jgi:HD-GYP domain-containing protein (c-di-GMP phosphodiesterase class II)